MTGGDKREGGEHGGSGTGGCSSNPQCMRAKAKDDGSHGSSSATVTITASQNKGF